jgi:hypothetical protein
MTYKLLIAEADVLGKAKFVNDKGNTECVEFVRQAAGAPKSTEWRKGVRVGQAKAGEIPRGSVIATFDSNDRYPTDTLGRHAAIYLAHDEQRILVLDQWNAQGQVLQRPIWFNRPKGTKRSNDADTFYLVK